MFPPSKRSASTPPHGSALAVLAERPQLDFELDFFAPILARLPDFADVLRPHAANLSLKGLAKEGLLAEQRLAELTPGDADVHYALARRYADLKQPDLALDSLRKAIELGFCDFRAMIQDRALEGVRKDPRFRALLREYSER